MRMSEISGVHDKILRNGLFIGFSAKKYMSNQYILARYGCPLPVRHERGRVRERSNPIKTASSPHPLLHRSSGGEGASPVCFQRRILSCAQFSDWRCPARSRARGSGYYLAARLVDNRAGAGATYGRALAAPQRRHALNQRHDNQEKITMNTKRLIMLSSLAVVLGAGR